MDIYSFAPVATVLDLAYTLVTVLAQALAPLSGGFSAALAVVVVTIAVRLLLLPVGRSQVRAELTRRRLAPRLRDLRRRYGKDPELLQRKTMELYAEEKASPLAGCLPTLLQAPVLSVLYGLFVLATIDGHPNGLLAEHLLSVPLGASLPAFLGASAAAWPGVLVYLVLLAGIAAVAAVSRVHALRFAEPPAEDAPEAVLRMTRALSWAPLATVVFAALVPLAATLYLAVSTTWTLIERAIFRHRLRPALG
ncbi:YidC/Oxa1 family membrane protein insertase [Planctomonas deserti]|uniref:YidC/Oxa1 family membrane protein insertase n=1 Tax=Planctomonas deserti TaxID=2144185 RepID=UPI000D3B9E65|nr:YidC/Oxa1 family membrane protein insertase [Planctomonas deserti]